MIYEDKYLELLANQANQEIIEEGKLFNSLVAAGALFAGSLFAPKVDAQTVGKTPEIEMTSDVIAPRLSQDELLATKFLYTFGYNSERENGTYTAIKDVEYIARTFASRLILLKEAPSIAELIKKTCRSINFDYDFYQANKLTETAEYFGKLLVQNPASIAWNTTKAESPVYFIKHGIVPPKSNTVDLIKRFETKGFDFYLIRRKASVNKDANVANLDSKSNFLAKVLYSETSSTCTDEEVKLICQVIMNRIGKPDFGTFNGKRMIAPKDPYEVVNVPYAFSAVKNHNTPWNDFDKRPNDPYVKRDKALAKAMMSGNVSSLNLPGNKDIVYYHDKSIDMPNKWINKYWLPVEVYSTDHFKFYKVIRNTNKLSAADYKKSLNKS